MKNVEYIPDLLKSVTRLESDSDWNSDKKTAAFHCQRRKSLEAKIAAGELWEPNF